MDRPSGGRVANRGTNIEARGPIEPWHVGASILVTFLVIATVASPHRPPWYDELLVLHFVEDLSLMPSRVAGTAHPLGYYVLLAPAAQIWRATTWLRMWGLVALPAAAVAACWGLVGQRRRWLEEVLAAAGPALVGVGVAVRFASDLRMYGGLALAVVVVACAFHVWDEQRAVATAQVWSAAAAVTLLAAVHVWGAVIGAVLAGQFLYLGRPPRRKVVLAAGSAVGILLVAYWWGPLQMAGLRQVLASGLGVLPAALAGGVSSQRWLAVALVVALAASIPFTHDRRVVRWFDVPVLVSLGLIVAVSLIVPIVQYYTVGLLLVPLFAGLMLRVRQSMLGYAVVSVLLLTNAVVHLPVLFHGHPGVQNGRPWMEAAAYVEAKADPSCGVLVYPEWRELSATAWYLREVDLSPISAPQACACDRRWFIANHLWPQEQRTEVLRMLDDPIIEVDWGEAFVGTASCSNAAARDGTG